VTSNLRDLLLPFGLLILLPADHAYRSATIRLRLGFSFSLESGEISTATKKAKKSFTGDFTIVVYCLMSGKHSHIHYSSIAKRSAKKWTDYGAIIWQ
jgi:hypothetical protein